MELFEQKNDAVCRFLFSGINRSILLLDMGVAILRIASGSVQRQTDFTDAVEYIC
jgi:hypothetical protein